MTTISGTYLKTQQVANALGVSVSTVKRWVDSGVLGATRTVGKHRLIPRHEAERFARMQGLSFLMEDEAPLIAPRRIDEPLVDLLATTLRSGRGREARDLILGAYRGAGPTALADDLIRPVMQRIGHDWEARAIDVYHEHRATRVVTHALMEIVHDQQGCPPGDDAPLALGAAPEGDPYLLPGLLCEMVLRDLGWEVMNLGVNLPLASLARAVRAHRPRVTWVSVSYLDDRTQFPRAYAAFHDEVSADGTAVIVGGQALTPELRARMVAASFGDRMAHLAEFARRSAPEAAAPTDRPNSNSPT